jgi:hypothetical protein
MTARGRYLIAFLPLLFTLNAPSGCRAVVWFADPIVTQTPYDFTDLQARDLEGDGHVEVVANDLTVNKLIVYNTSPDGTMTEVQAIAHNDPLYGGRHWFLLIDADHDIYPDLLVNCSG